MIQGRCPICAKTYVICTIDELPTFPFCSERCRLIDVGRWADGRYVVPGEPATAEPAAGADQRPADEAD
jgi:endogenous inhibitor of DNA gyrase (YacG/DUF329 family)